MVLQPWPAQFQSFSPVAGHRVLNSFAGMDEEKPVCLKANVSALAFFNLECNLGKVSNRQHV
jgi:hypothetical protein